MKPEQKKEKEKEKCSHIGCYDDAVWKGTATKESIAAIKDREIKQNKKLFQPGEWFYCDKHKENIKGYCPHLQFEAI